ncbi:DUF1403 family protein [Paracoccus rhizosphaerae]|nr:DUF1403 family protein [Paracoccus rhizosphaerae]
MRTPAARPADRPDPPPLPDWLTAPAAERPEDLPFLAGAALASLHGLQSHPAVPQVLWRARLALRAAAACARLERRRETEAELRDALHLLRPGDHPGPAGAILQLWTRAGTPPLAVLDWGHLLPNLDAEAQAAGQGDAAPVTRAAAVLEAVLGAAPRAETAALILAEAALGRSLGWTHLTPLLAPGLSARDLRATGAELQLACHRALVRAAGPASRLAADLARRAARLQAVAPGLRARGADRAVALFLSHDALAPSALTGIMSDRAARRLCDRLVELDAVRELTGRPSFRLYGL